MELSPKEEHEEKGRNESHCQSRGSRQANKEGEMTESQVTPIRAEQPITEEREEP